MHINAMTDVWSNAGTVYSAVKMTVTATTFSANSKLLDLLVAPGVSKFSVSPAGDVIASGTMSVTGALKPAANDGAALGASGTAWSDLFLASGGVINWAAGDVTMTHSAEALVFAGAATYRFNNGALTVANTDAAGTLAVRRDSTISPTVSQLAGQLLFQSEDDHGTIKNFASLNGQAVDPTETSEDGALFISTYVAGTFAVRHWFTNNLYPGANDGGSLGLSSAAYSDLFLASGAVINFAAGDVTITHSSNLLTFAGATSGYSFDTTIRPDINDGGQLGTATLSWSDLFLASGAVLNFANGDVTITHAANALAFAGATTNGYSFADGPVKPAVNNGVSLGVSGTAWSDLFLATGGVINWGAGNVTITHATDALTFSNAAVAIANTDASASAILRRNDTSSPFVAETIGALTFQGENTVGALTNYASLSGYSLVTTDGSEDGALYMGVYVNGAFATRHWFTNNIYPNTNDGGSLGINTNAYSDLFLANGGIVNWANGDVTITHSSNLLTFAGATSGYSFDTTIRPDINDGGQLGTAALSWSDLFLASGAVINFANGDVNFIHSTGVLTVSSGDLRVTTAGTNAASVVTVGGAQTLTGKTLTQPVLTLVQSAAPVPTAEGRVEWDTDGDCIVVGNGGGQAIFGQVTPWVAYTPTFTGFGTVTGISVWSRRVGDTLHIRGKFTAGTSTAVEARMTLGFNGVNGGITIDATKVPSLQLAGYGAFGYVTPSTPAVLVEPSVGYITFGFQSATTAALTKATANTFLSANAFSFTAEIPITGW